MRHVDALSRVSCLSLEDSLKFRLQQAQTHDEWVRVVIKVLEKDSYDNFYIKHGILYKDPPKELVPAIRQGHFSGKKTQEAVEKSFYIPGLLAKVAKVVRSCVECIIAEAKIGKKGSSSRYAKRTDR